MESSQTNVFDHKTWSRVKLEHNVLTDELQEVLKRNAVGKATFQGNTVFFSPQKIISNFTKEMKLSQPVNRVFWFSISFYNLTAILSQDHGKLNLDSDNPIIL